MSHWAVRWRRAPVSGRPPTVRRSGQAARRATTRTWSPRQLGLDLVDVTYSGATTANVLTDPQNGAPPQVDALDGSEDLVTVTIGGNDAGYVPLLMAAGLPRIVRSLPLIGGVVREHTRPDGPRSGAGRGGRVVEGGRPHAAPAVAAGEGAVRRLPDPAAAGGTPRLHCPMSTSRWAVGSPTRWSASPARRPPTPAAQWVRVARGQPRTPCLVTYEPWTTKFGLPLPGRPAPLHPNAEGMRAVADLVVAHAT